MPESTEERPNRLPWPPILYAATLALAAGLHRFVPIAEFSPGFWGRAVGAAIVVAGVAVAAAGVLRFRAIGTPVDPRARAVALATTGIYAYTRNPMYLGITTAFLGLGLAFASPWLFVLTPVMAIALRKLAIEREERHLEARFGDAYRAYRRQVRRWL